MTYMQRSLKYLKELGYHCGVVERFIYQARINIDLFNIIDVISLTERGVLGVQVCGYDFAEHKSKIMHEEAENTVKWLSTPNTELLLIGWRKLKVKRGGRAMVWKPRIADITLQNKKLIFNER